MKSVLTKLRSIKIKRAKEPFRPTRTIDDLEVLLSLNNKSSSTTYNKRLSSILLRFAFWTGCRVSEISSMKLENIFFNEGKILILHGKGGKNRWLGINKNIKDSLKDYIENHRPRKASPFLFVLENGSKLTRDRIEKRIKLLLTKAGMEGAMHSFRRGCFTTYASKGVPISHLQLIAGHSSILTTQSYIRPDVEQVIKEQQNW